MANSSKNKSAGSSGLVKAYLLFYNFASCAAWGHVLLRAASHLAAEESGGFATLYSAIGDELLWVQTGAALEILHSLFGLVRSPVGTTVTQVFSRLLLVWGICNQFHVPAVQSHWAYTSMTFAWSITEVVRYLFYGLNLLGQQPSWLLWCRYTFFLVLYPIGAGSEAMLVYQALPAADALYPYYGYILRAILLVYPPGLGVMYTHMLGQRKRYLRAQALDKGKKRQ
ncbi:protein tyrosine phosphatase [Thamnocephalis sphaerospora]|uniref:Very-long-chain (3R)-3-hydroxyacyl-CoA dehydratase n=1 Tax=Thamnocephalis sphaerospora TaxID=78915 RepID=A0A4P9XVJ7_9FUNG|nr:protein tyrosine phosphatase [Thamnocephalis sphaerospora]|eukprot:RKP10286.1 protein tyrosine phosphatase [Thamnocephalis sphaerospora]